MDEFTTNEHNRLRDLREQRAAKAQRDELNKIKVIAKGIAKTELGLLPAEAEKKAGSMGSDAVVAVMLHVELGKAASEPKALLKQFRQMVPALKAKVDGGASSRVLIDALSAWLTAEEGRIQAAGAAVPKIMVLMYDAAVIEEQESREFWDAYCASTGTLETATATAAAEQERTAQETIELRTKAEEAEEIAKQSVIDDRTAKKAAENSKCGGGATAEEEAWEKECAQKHRLAIKAKEQATARASALKKSADSIYQDKLAAAKVMESASVLSAAAVAMKTSYEPYIKWLDTAEVA